MYVLEKITWQLGSKAPYTLATELNSTRSTLLKVDKVDRVGVALAPYSTPWRQSRKVHSGDRFGDKIDRIGNKVDRIGDKVDRRQCVPGLRHTLMTSYFVEGWDPFGRRAVQAVDLFPTRISRIHSDATNNSPAKDRTGISLGYNANLRRQFIPPKVKS